MLAKWSYIHYISSGRSLHKNDKRPLWDPILYLANLLVEMTHTVGGHKELAKNTYFKAQHMLPPVTKNEKEKIMKYNSL